MLDYATLASRQYLLSLNDLFEYKAVSIIDNSTGSVNIEAVNTILTKYANDGWRLVGSYSGEIGRNSSSSGAYGMSTGTNATIDESILIFERRILTSEQFQEQFQEHFNQIKQEVPRL